MSGRGTRLFWLGLGLGLVLAASGCVGAGSARAERAQLEELTRRFTATARGLVRYGPPEVWASETALVTAVWSAQPGLQAALAGVRVRVRVVPGQPPQEVVVQVRSADGRRVLVEDASWTIGTVDPVGVFKSAD